jgi:hypothetical protein
MTEAEFGLGLNVPRPSIFLSGYLPFRRMSSVCGVGLITQLKSSSAAVSVSLDPIQAVAMLQVGPFSKSRTPSPPRKAYSKMASLAKSERTGHSASHSPSYRV